MRCKKHPSDPSAGVGVCATCLRERLFALIAAQAQAQQALAHAQHQHAPVPPQLAFPRSVSPYVSRRKSDGSAAAADAWGHNPPEDRSRRRNHHHHLRFYSTPQVGPTYDPSSIGDRIPVKKKKGRFSLFSNLFRSRSEKIDPAKVSYRDPYATASTSSPNWFSAIFTSSASHRRSQFSCDDSSSVAGVGAGARRSRTRTSDRGMSPERGPDFDCDGDRSPSGSGHSSESSPRWKRTPSTAPAQTRRSKPGQNRNGPSGLTFCLSPLVRASPNRHWMSQKGLPPEIGGKSGEAARVPAKPHLSNAASFCKNRSRKLADFGRANVNR